MFPEIISRCLLPLISAQEASPDCVPSNEGGTTLYSRITFQRQNAIRSEVSLQTRPEAAGGAFLTALGL